MNVVRLARTVTDTGDVNPWWRLFWPRVGVSVSRPSWVGSVPPPMRDEPWFWSVSALGAAWLRLVGVGAVVAVLSGLVGGLVGEWAGLAIAIPYLALCAAAWLRTAFAMSSYWQSRRNWEWRGRVSPWHLRVIPRLLLHPR